MHSLSIDAAELTGLCDMCDVLLAASESEFFTRHHYGRGRFERDETGRVARLVHIEGPREFVATRCEPSGTSSEPRSRTLVAL